MGPKKGKGTKKKSKKKGLTDAATDDEKCWILQSEIDSLNERFFEV